MTGLLRVAALVALLVSPAFTRAVQAQDRADNERICRAAVVDSLGQSFMRLTVEQVSGDAGGTALVNWQRSDGPYGSCRIESGRLARMDIHRTTQPAATPNQPVPAVRAPVVVARPVAGERVTCASNDNRRAECAIRRESDVRLATVLSDAPCQENRTWGRDATHIWVDKGCRAEFEVRARETVESEDRTNPASVKQTDIRSMAACRTEVRNHYQIPMPQIVTQIASRQGEGTVDVDWHTAQGSRGNCRVNRHGKVVRFEIEGEGSRAAAPSTVALERRVTCGSQDGNRTECPIPPGSEVRLTKKLSDAVCTQGWSWGADSKRNVIWVDRGCRGEFVVISR
jgi:hypothetical protein